MPKPVPVCSRALTPTQSKVFKKMTVQEIRIQSPDGDIYARSWMPEMPADNAVERAMDLPPVLLFHDSLGCSDLWRDFPAALAKRSGRKIISYDRLGFGRSASRSDTLPFDFIAAEAREIVPVICRAFGIKKFVACGHSVGGAMAIETAAYWRDDCAAAITVSAQAFVENKTAEGIRAAQAVFAAPESFARLEKYHAAKTRWVLDAWTNTWLSPAFADWNLDNALAVLTCPVLAIHGGADEYGGTAHAERIAGVSGEVLILPAAGHFPHREEPERILDTITKFLKPL